MTSFGKKKNAFGHKKELTLESLLRVVEQQQDKIDEFEQIVNDMDLAGSDIDNALGLLEHAICTINNIILKKK